MDDKEIEILDIEILDIDADISRVDAIDVRRKSNKKAVITFIVLDVLALIGLFLTYGPVDHFRDLLVTTAMRTQSHKYLARIFYSTETINKVMANNYVEQFNENTDADDIKFGDNTDTGVYASIYEEQILKRDPNNDDYKIIELSGTDVGIKYKGYLVAIYDPSRVELAVTKNLGVIGQRLRDITKDKGALVGINASGFEDPNERGLGGRATGVVVKDGKIIWGNNAVASLAGFNRKNVLVLTTQTPEQAIKEGMRDAVQFGPFLIVNGKPAIIKGNGGWGYDPRTALAQRKDGIVLFLVIDGRQPGHSSGVSIKEMIRIFTRYQAHNAVNLDGGASSTLVVNNKVYNQPCAYNETGERWIPNAWILK